ncbi:MAG: hypothetical protein JO023_04760 [Chloroflexi bacterium]|nr:hypothetical protein [Chloroflexota bacterium]
MRGGARQRRPQRVLVSLVLVLALAVWAVPSVSRAAPDDADRQYQAALRTQSATRARLSVLGDAFDCPDARLVSYRLSDADPQSVAQWYVASQLWADAALLNDLRQAPAAPAGWDAGLAQCYLDKGFVFLDRLWDFSSAGYFSRSDPIGGDAVEQPKFGDDNALAGLALLEAARATTDPLASQQYVHAARRQADFLSGSSLWDGTFGGGFWWNTTHGGTPEGKPAQTNALAALFFARLYDATGDPSYRDWTRRTLLWLDTMLYDPNRHLYHWSLAYADPEQHTGSVRADRYFGYDQSIAIAAQVEDAGWDADPARLKRAEAIGVALQTNFWAPELGGYTLQAGVPVVYTAYGAWSSLGQLALYDADHDPAWLEQARANASALKAVFGEPDGGYGFRDYACPDPHAAGCETSRNGVEVDHTRDTAAQAWAQQLQAALAVRSTAAGLPTQVP